jgi:hypothetical protein
MDRELVAVRKTVKVLPAAVRRRDAAIVAAVDAGYSLRVVGDAAGLSHVAVLRIVRRFVRPTSAG